MRFARPFHRIAAALRRARRSTGTNTTAHPGPGPGTGRHRTPGTRPAANRRRPLITSAVVVCAVLVAVLALRDASGPSGSEPSGMGEECRPTELLEPPCGAWFGAFVPHERADLENRVEAYEQRVGRKLDIVYTYHDMSLPEGTRREGQLLSPEEQRVGKDRMLLLSWESKWWGGTKEQQPTWQEIADGDLDATVIDVQARRVKDYGQRTGKKVFLSFDLEMDTRTPDNGTPAQYVKAYRHIHDRFRELGVDNVVWTWIITGYLSHGDLFKGMYPGDEYVDWIGYNQYNYYRCHKTKWLTFEQTQTATHDWIRENISADKPLMLSEFGSAADDSRSERQAEWYARVPPVLKGLDGVKAALQWNHRDPGPHCDLAVANEAAWESLREVVSDPYLNQPTK
ncbi:glycoside hydrolase family 26 protein [Streptomyces sp. NWU339]|uniref:glycoside hydrolase family 26 protein n=1 Tax=Streptomyces sp. NWU339 TaxID=2185284 RepID=UPI00215A1462|nr:glycoside hydrolase family 26 protein [Streptomyces sp. NWU339]